MCGEGLRGMLLLIAALCGIIASALVTALTLRLLGRRGVFDVPNHRSSHQTPTVRGGGIGLAFGTLVALAVDRSRIFGSTDVALLVAGICFGAIGFADDLISGISIKTRMILQIVAALLVMRSEERRAWK